MQKWSVKPGDLVRYEPPKVFLNFAHEMKRGDLGMFLRDPFGDGQYAVVVTGSGSVLAMTKYLRKVDESQVI